MNDIANKAKEIIEDYNSILECIKILSGFNNYIKKCENDAMKLFSSMYPLQWDSKVLYEQDRSIIKVGYSLQRGYKWISSGIIRTSEITDFQSWRDILLNYTDDIINLSRKKVKENIKDFAIVLANNEFIADSNKDIETFLNLQDFDITLLRNNTFLKSRIEKCSVCKKHSSDYKPINPWEISFKLKEGGSFTINFNDLGYMEMYNMIQIEDIIPELLSAYEQSVIKFEELKKPNEEILEKLKLTVIDFIVLEELKK